MRDNRVFDLPDLVEREGAWTAGALPASCYTSAEFFAFERETVFGRSWLCVGRSDQVPTPGDYFSLTIADEPIIVVRGMDGDLRVLSALCRHRGHILTEDAGNTRLFTCPLHHWTFDTKGFLVGAPRMGSLDALRASTRLPEVRSEVWHGFIFANFDESCEALAPSLAKVEFCWDGIVETELVTVPPDFSRDPLPWNWKAQFENFTDAYHPEFVHPRTHKYLPSQGVGDGVQFTSMSLDDNAIARSVPFESANGGMTSLGWGADPIFPAVFPQADHVNFVMVPPTLMLIFAPSLVGYSLVYPQTAERTLVAGDRLSAGGWILPRTTFELPDFEERSKQYREGSRSIGDEDIPVNQSLQAGKHSRFTPDNRYGTLEVTLEQFNAWLVSKYRSGSANKEFVG